MNIFSVSAARHNRQDEQPEPDRQSQQEEPDGEDIFIYDGIVGELMNKRDYFTLAREFHGLYDKMQIPVFREIAAGQVAEQSNDDMAATIHFRRALEEYGEQLDPAGYYGISALLVRKLYETGQYETAREYLSVVTSDGALEWDAGTRSYMDHMACLLGAGVPAVSVELPGYDVELPARLLDNTVLHARLLRDNYRLWGGELTPGEEDPLLRDFEKKQIYDLVIDVQIGGKTVAMHLDTGADCGMVVTEKFAEENADHIRIIYDSLIVGGTGVGIMKVGILDRMDIGDIVVENVQVYVSTDPMVNIIYDAKQECILGRGVLGRLGEIHLYPRRGKFVVAADHTPIPAWGQNMIIVEGQPLVEVLHGEERMIFHFDTGNSGAGLGRRFFEQHRDYVETVGEHEQTVSGGFGMIGYTERWVLPDFEISLGETQVTLKNMEVRTDDVFSSDPIEDGSLGMAWVALYDKLIINFDKMFVAGIKE